MSESDINESERNDSESDEIDLQQPTWDILVEHQGIKIDEKFILKLQKGTKNVIKEVKDSCKVLHFSSEWNFEDILSAIDGLDSKDYPQLFTFVIEATNFEFNGANQAESLKSSLKLQENLTKFGFFRPMILQMTSEAENVRKIWFKNETLNQFTVIEQHQDEPDQPNAFSSVLKTFLDENFDDFEDDVLDILPQLLSRSFVSRFLRSLNLTDGFFGGMILELAANGTRDELIAALDAPFNSNGRMLSIRAQEYIAHVFKNDDDPENDDSVLLKALNNNNKDVINYLITYWSHLIQLLPIEHKIKISTAAFDTNQLDILCDLISIADFPFPKDFKVDSVEHPRLKKIEAERTGFKATIKTKDFDKIDEFIKNNRNLKFIYSPANKSALTEAIKLKKFGVFYYLKSLGLKGEDCDDILKKLSEKRRKQAVKQAAEQRKKNISQSQDIAPKSVMKLLMRSSIHNSRTDKEQQAQYRANIMKWFTAIHKVSSELIDVAATCEHLKIIFDFESDSVENVSLTGSGASGSAYPISKWIFVGAKLSDEYGNIIKQREQKIKGVLAHELCHYVMRLVYENQEYPYFKHKVDLKEIFEAIVRAIDKWSAEDSEKPDDECNGIISSVFTAYKPKDFQQELIVRIVHMLTEYDDDDAQSINLQGKYRILFDFWINHVIPELRNYLLRNKDIVKLNGFAELLHRISQHQIEVKPGKPIKELIDSKLNIVTTNHPQLLFIDICKNLKEKFGVLMDTKNFFVEPEKLTNPTILNELKLICTENSELSIYIDCTKQVPKYLGNIFINKELNFIFVVSNEKQCKELKRIFRKIRENAKEMEVNYSWSDLTEESQNSLLETKIKFQNNSNISLCNLLKNRKEAKQDFSQIFNDQLLNFLVEKKIIFVNNRVEDKEDDFEFIYQSRKFVKKEKDEKDQVGAEVDREFRKRNEKEASIISQKDLLSEVKSKQYVLISDQAGNGKSWATKNITNILQEQNPTNWVTYVDLKQFIEVFKAQKDDPEFSSFMVEHILKSQQQFEAKIFQKMYKDGKVFILFDGFDEIAPNYAKFVSKLAQNFQQNGGNQLWIATREFFEVDLKKKLKLDIAYSLDKMTEEEGVDLIARSWILVDLRKEKQELASKEDFDECIKKSTKFKNYLQKARKIIKKALICNNNPVGRPQLFKMIADTFKDEENIDDLQGIKIYDKFIDILYKRWSQQKGEIRNQANTEVQKNDSSFFKFLRFHAILSFFPKLAKILFPNYNGSEWPNEEIIACGILTIINGKVYFIHETFREYFAADAIAKGLKKSKVDENVVEVFVEILTLIKFGVIRVFLNDMIGDSSVVIKIQPQVENNIEKFYEMSSFGDFFTKNLQNFVDLVLDVLKTGNYEKVKKILQNSAKNIAEFTEDSKMFLIFQELIFDYLKVNDLKDLIIKGKVFLGMIKSGLEIEIFKDFVAKTEAKTDREFVKQALVSHNYPIGNIFYLMAASSNLNAQKVQKFLKIYENFFTVNEIFELMSKCNDDEQNILQACVKWTENKENLKILWTEIEKYFTEQNLPQNFKVFVKQQDRRGRNILHAVALCDKIEVHETLWELLLKLIEDREELKEFILQKDKYGDNFAHDLVCCNKNPTIFELTFNNLKENFNDAQFQEILTSKGFKEMNLLQSALFGSKVIEVLQFLWKFFRDFCGTGEKFLEMLKEVDDFGQNILQIAAENNSSSEIFEFMIQELEKIASRDEIRKMLRNLNNFWSQNLLQSAAHLDNNPELHKTLWKTLRKYFEKSEIMQSINIVDKDGKNLLFNAVYRLIALKEILELTWNEIISFFTHDEQVEYLKVRDLKDLIIKGKVFLGIIKSSLNIEVFEDFVAKTEAKTDREFVKQGLMLVSDVYDKNNIFYCLAESSNLNAQKVQIFLKFMEKYFTVTEIFELMTKCNEIEQNIFQACVKWTKNEENLKILLIEIEKYFTEQNLPQSFKEFVKQQGRWGNNILHDVAWCNKIEVHETLWELLLKLIEDREELKEFILQKDKYGDNFAHDLVCCNKNPTIFELTFNNLKENFNDAQFQEILTSKGFKEMNLLQSALFGSKVIEVLQFLWKFFRDFHGTDEKFLEMLKEVDDFGRNILQIATYHSSSEVFEFMIQELDKIASRDEIREMLRNLNNENQNLLQSAAQSNYSSYSSEPHKTLWKTLRKYFEKSEILQFIYNVDKNGNSLLFNVVIGYMPSEEILELTWNEIKSFLNHDKQVEYLKVKGKDGKNLLECALENTRNNSNEIHEWVENIMQEYEIEFLIPQKKKQVKVSGQAIRNFFNNSQKQS